MTQMTMSLRDRLFFISVSESKAVDLSLTIMSHPGQGLPGT